MKISVNLATRPYIDLRPIYNRLRTWTAILALVGLAVWFLYRSERNQAQRALARVAQVQHHVQALEQERSSYETLMQQPKNAAILRQSDFLNSLFRRKAFSWTATMTDLETVLPPGVEVLSIDPIVSPDGHVVIRLRVTGERDRAVDLIRNLENSHHFAQPRLASESVATPTGGSGPMQQVSDSNMVIFDILADYRPLPLPSHGKPQETEQEKTVSTPGKAAPAAAKAHSRVARQRHPKPAAGKTQVKARAQGR